MDYELTNDVYFAAPFFCDAEKDFNLKLVAILESASISVFYPPRDGVVAKSELDVGLSWNSISDNIWECDTNAILSSKLIVALIDGRTIDEGVCVEIGFAAAHGRPILAFASDDRSQFAWGHNPMIIKPISKFISCSSKLVCEVRKILESENF